MAEPAGFWTIANGLSVLRAVLTGPTLYCLWLGPAYRWHVFAIVTVMIVTDILDGAVARMRGETSEWGKILDPIADKIAIDAISALLVYLKGLPLWVAAAVIGRDVLIVAGGALMASRIRVVPPSNAWGKATTCVMAALLVCFAMDFDTPKTALVYAAGILIVASTVSYAVTFARDEPFRPDGTGVAR